MDAPKRIHGAGFARSENRAVYFARRRAAVGEARTQGGPSGPPKNEKREQRLTFLRLSLSIAGMNPGCTNALCTS